jgi:hypothetical protein
MQKYILVHEHRFGTDAHPFQTEGIVDPGLLPAIAEKLKVYFEEDREEVLTLVTLDKEEFPVIDLNALTQSEE